MIDAPNKVIGYAYAWNAAANRGRVTVSVQEGGEPTTLDVDDIHVFQTIASALNSEYAYFDRRTRTVFADRLGSQRTDRPLTGEGPFPW
jgi:hypothetical protein